MLAWPKPSDFDAMLKTGVRRSGRTAVASYMFPMSSHHTIAASRQADRARVRLWRFKGSRWGRTPNEPSTLEPSLSYARMCCANF